MKLYSLCLLCLISSLFVINCEEVSKPGRVPLKKSYKLAFFGPLNVLLIMLWNVGIITTLIVFVTTLAEFIPIQDAPLFSNFGKVFLIIAIVFHFLSFVFEIVFIYILIAIYQNLKRRALRLNQESFNYT
ncbi:hypothetical protein HMI56_006600 [Coelomomyces lativittatus]|nr:hypothetical protein HMI56_006600 [Coelomomyces lativittatus]